MPSRHDPEDSKNFLIWGHWGGDQIEKPLLTEKIHGACKRCLVGKQYCVVLRSDGLVVSWGDNKQGMLGLGPDHLQSIDPERVSNIDEKISDIQQGKTHILALTVSGRIFAWGCNEFGQLGVGDIASRFEPTLVNLNDSVKQIVCVNDCSFAVGQKGDVYSWGDNRGGLLALEKREATLQPTPVLGLHPNAISRLDVVDQQGEKTLVAFIDYDTQEDEESDGDIFEAGDVGGGGINGEYGVYQGVHYLRKTLNLCQQWYAEITQLQHGAPYERDANGDFVLNVNPVVYDDFQMKNMARNDLGPYDLDSKVGIDVLFKAVSQFDKILATLGEQAQQSKRAKFSKSAKFLIDIFTELCRLRREKIQRTILARDLVQRKKFIENVAGTGSARAQAQPSSARVPMGNSKLGSNATSALRNSVVQLRENVSQVRLAATRNDVALQALQASLLENLEVKLLYDEMQLELIEKGVKDIEPYLPALNRLRQAWNDVKSFNIQSLYEECDQRHFDFGTSDAHVAHLVRMSQEKIDAVIEQYLTENMLLNRDGNIPGFVYDLLIENSELRKLAHQYQFRTMVQGKTSAKEMFHH